MSLLNTILEWCTYNHCCRWTLKSMVHIAPKARGSLIKPSQIAQTFLFLEKSECILCMKEICRYVILDGLINKYLTYRQSNSLMVLKPHRRKYHGRGAKTLSVTRRPRASKHRTRRFTWSGNSPMIAKLKGDFTI